MSLLPKEFVPNNLIAEIVKELDLKTEHGKRFAFLCLEQIKLFDNKQQDYGPHNISAFGELGCIVRTTDKFERLKNLYQKKSRKVRNEKLDDTFMDIANYMIIVRMLRRQIW